MADGSEITYGTDFSMWTRISQSMFGPEDDGSTLTVLVAIPVIYWIVYYIIGFIVHQKYAEFTKSTTQAITPETALEPNSRICAEEKSQSPPIKLEDNFLLLIRRD